MGKIYCVMGKSSSGKDSIYHQIMEKGVLALKPIIPYTTRPIRDGEQDGRNKLTYSSIRLPRAFCASCRLSSMPAISTYEGELVS